MWPICISSCANLKNIRSFLRMYVYQSTSRYVICMTTVDLYKHVYQLIHTSIPITCLYKSNRPSHAYQFHVEQTTRMNNLNHTTGLTLACERPQCSQVFSQNLVLNLTVQHSPIQAIPKNRKHISEPETSMNIIWSWSGKFLLHPRLGSQTSHSRFHHTEL
jgi:hypothetical protein